MALDPSIAMGFRGAQIENPLEQYKRAMQAQAAQQQNALMQMQIAQEEQARQEQNALRGLYREAVTPQGTVDYNKLTAAAARRGLGYLTPQFEEARAAQDTRQMASEKSRLNIIRSKAEDARDYLAQIDPAAPDAAERIMALHEATHADPDMNSYLVKNFGATAERGRAEIARIAQGGPQAIAQYLERATTGAATVAEHLRQQELDKPILMTPGQVLVSPEGKRIYTAPPSPKAAPAQRQPAAAPAAAAPAAAPARVPVGTPAQQAKAQAQSEAKIMLSQELGTVLGYYENLNDMRAMPSPSRTAPENILASVRSSEMGQGFERTVATKAQTLRDNIANSRQRLLSHIKNATGASAQQMNSNVELQTWLNALTNPRQSIETVRETLGQLDSVIAGVERQVEKDRQKTDKKPSEPSGGVPTGVDPALWNVMTPEERALWKK